MAGILNFYGYGEPSTPLLSAKQKQEAIDKGQDEKIEGLEKGGGAPKESLIETTYLDLVKLRDDGKLIPGCHYRITDYETTTSQSGTRSAGHLFDVVVLALTNDSLSEEAFACKSERDVSENIVVTVGGESIIANRVPEIDGDYQNEHYYGYSLDDLPVYLKSLTTTPTLQTVYVFIVDGDNQAVPIEEAIIAEDKGLSITVTNMAMVSPIPPGINVKIKFAGYFDACNLDAWKVWYSLDNNRNRFLWAKDNGRRIRIEQSGPDGWRNTEHDIPKLGLYAWEFSDRETYYAYTFEESPNIGDYTVFTTLDGESLTITSVTTESIQCNNNDLYSRDSSLDKNGYYGWRNETIKPLYPEIIFTKTESPVVGDEISVTSNSGRIITDISWNGKGVIYRMIDEFGNDCPYDFKNIQFLTGENAMVGLSGDVYYYTFSIAMEDGLVCDYSIKDIDRDYAYSNIINEYVDYSNRYKLNNIVLLGGRDCHSNTFGENCYDINIGDDCANNIFSNDCHGNVIGEGCYGNTFGNRFTDSTISNNFLYNVIGGHCSNITTSGTTEGITIETGCGYINLQKAYIAGIKIETGNRNINITSNQTTSYSNRVGNFIITQAVNNNYHNYKTISHNTVNDTIRTVYEPSGSTIVNV